jgi:hypothetical protein
MSGGSDDTTGDSGAPDGGLPLSARQEHFALRFVRMIAATAGCWIKNHETDYDGVDITIASSATYETYYGPEFELQLKCTTQQHLLRDDHMTCWCSSAAKGQVLRQGVTTVSPLLAWAYFVCRSSHGRIRASTADTMVVALRVCRP